MNRLFIFLILLSFGTNVYASGADPFISKAYVKGSLPLFQKGKVISILTSGNDWPGVMRAAKDLQLDFKKVTGVEPLLTKDQISGMAIIIGTIGKSQLIDDLIKNNQINVSGIAGKWESTLIEVIKNPFKGIDSALVIAGSDKRGTIYGIYELSSQIGVSPWYYWADVPVNTSNSLFALSGRHVIASPAVKYRGIFLNDEAPALSAWSKKEFGGFNSKFYAQVFELMLRLKANYLWPAMWGSAFNDDDKMNPVLADEYGIVMGTSHHEPLSRAHDEWKRYKGDKWNYDQNPEQLKAFWESGFKRVADKEQIITVGMRGDGDEPMTEGTATALLEKIVNDQRQIIEKVTRKPAAETPQLWALYKEVQDYYDKGMRVPDDITLLLCDDNWGNIRKLPKLGEAPRKGGYGIYYHFDYVGDPRNYKWVNTNPIQKIWEQMNLAYQYQANQIWIVNVGDLKPMEFPISFFLDYAWAPDAIPVEKLKQYTIGWSAKQFGFRYAEEIADIMDWYAKYNGRIKPELLNDQTYSIIDYNEFENVVSDYQKLEQRARFVYNQIPADQKDAFYQLVMHPVEASANLNALYLYVAKNKFYAKQGRVSAIVMASKVAELYQHDQEISDYYNKIMAGGKWDHMMDQTHIGYTNWQQPDRNSIPKTVAVAPTEQKNSMNPGVAIEGSDLSWANNEKINLPLPMFDYYTNRSHYFELFNIHNSFKYQIKAPRYVMVKESLTETNTDKRIWLSINWAIAPKGLTDDQITVKFSNGIKFEIPIKLDNSRLLHESFSGFIDQNGYLSIEAPNYSRAVNNRPISWKTLPNYGKTLGGMMPVSVTMPVQKLTASAAHLEYDIFLNHTGTFILNSFISPTIDFSNTEGLKFAVSVDDQPPVIVNISLDNKSQSAWRKSVANSIKIFKTPLQFNQPGKHTIKYWMVSPGVVLQKLVLDLGGLKPSYLGPPETFIQN